MKWKRILPNKSFWYARNSRCCFWTRRRQRLRLHFAILIPFISLLFVDTSSMPLVAFFYCSLWLTFDVHMKIQKIHSFLFKNVPLDTAIVSKHIRWENIHTRIEGENCSCLRAILHEFEGNFTALNASMTPFSDFIIILLFDNYRTSYRSNLI